VNGQNNCTQMLAIIVNLRHARHEPATCLTYRDTASAPMSGNVQMSSRMHASMGRRVPPPSAGSPTGGGMQSLVLTLAIFTGYQH
jgi:hypothetical protein